MEFATRPTAAHFIASLPALTLALSPPEVDPNKSTVNEDEERESADDADRGFQNVSNQFGDGFCAQRVREADAAFERHVVLLGLEGAVAEYLLRHVPGNAAFGASGATREPWHYQRRRTGQRCPLRQIGISGAASLLRRFARAGEFGARSRRSKKEHGGDDEYERKENPVACLHTLFQDVDEKREERVRDEDGHESGDGCHDQVASVSHFFAVTGRCHVFDAAPDEEHEGDRADDAEYAPDRAGNHAGKADVSEWEELSDRAAPVGLELGVCQVFRDTCDDLAAFAVRILRGAAAVCGFVIAEVVIPFHGGAGRIHPDVLAETRAFVRCARCVHVDCLASAGGGAHVRLVLAKAERASRRDVS